MSRLGLPGNRLPVKQSQLPPVRTLTAARGRGPRCSPFCAATGLTPTVETPGQRGARCPGPRASNICPIAARCPSRPAGAVRSPCAPSQPLCPSRSPRCGPQFPCLPRPRRPARGSGRVVGAAGRPPSLRPAPHRPPRRHAGREGPPGNRLGEVGPEPRQGQ